MRFAISSNPMLAQMVRQNPELEYILNNPEMLRTIMTPENIRMAMGMMQAMRGMPGAAPFGMPGMPGAAGTVPGTTAAPGTAGTSTGPASAGGVPPTFPGFDPSAFAQMMAGFGAAPQPGTSAAPPTGTTTTPPSAAGASAAPSAGAWQRPAFPNFAEMMRMFSPAAGGMGMPGAAPAAAPAGPPVDPKVKYAAQLEKMKEMGFTNEEVNLEALKATNGNIEAAVERILSMLK